MHLHWNLAVALGPLILVAVLASPLGHPNLVEPRDILTHQRRSLAVPPPSNCEREDNLTPWGTVETCGQPPIPKGHPSLTTPNVPDGERSPREYVTIITDAEVTLCRPWPNTVVPALTTQLFKWTALNLTCWTDTDRRIGTDGTTTRDAGDLWVKTGDQGCYINENDLRAHDVNFPQYLKKCKTSTGPYPLEPNPGPLIKPSADISSIPKAAQPLESANASASTPWPSAGPPLASSTSSQAAGVATASPTISSASETLTQSPRPTVATISPSAAGLGFQAASLVIGPAPERATPRPDATALISPAKALGGSTAASIPAGTSVASQASKPDITAMQIIPTFPGAPKDGVGAVVNIPVGSPLAFSSPVAAPATMNSGAALGDGV